jgi:hypothetical protein
MVFLNSPRGPRGGQWNRTSVTIAVAPSRSGWPRNGQSPIRRERGMPGLHRISPSARAPARARSPALRPPSPADLDLSQDSSDHALRGGLGTVFRRKEPPPLREGARCAPPPTHPGTDRRDRRRRHRARRNSRARDPGLNSLQIVSDLPTRNDAPSYPISAHQARR